MTTRSASLFSEATSWHGASPGDTPDGTWAEAPASPVAALSRGWRLLGPPQVLSGATCGKTPEENWHWWWFGREVEKP